MQYTREQTVEKLMESYQTYFDVTEYSEEHAPLVAVCEFYEHSQKYVLSQKAELWAFDCEEFIYLYSVKRLTREIFDSCVEAAREDGMNRAHIGKGHMYTYITPVFICETCDDDAVKALKKCRIYKSFRFSLHGWMDLHTAALDIQSDSIYTNSSGKSVGKILKEILYKSSRKRRSTQ